MAAQVKYSEEAQLALKGLEPNCLRCIHAPVCEVYRGFVRVTAADPAAEKSPKPVEAADLAKVCKMYAPTGEVLTA